MTVSIAPTSFNQAVAAYNRVAQQQGDGLQARDKAPADSFAEVMLDAAGSAIDSLKAGETQTLKAAAGQADITEVVMAVSQAEMTLETVVALRDRVIQAYQDIINMPI